MGGVEAGFAVRPQDEGQFLEHGAVVVQPGLVDADHHRNPFRLGAVEGREPALQAEVGAAMVAQARAGLGAEIEIVLAHPHAVPDAQARTGQTEARDMREG